MLPYILLTIYIVILYFTIKGMSEEDTGSDDFNP